MLLGTKEPDGQISPTTIRINTHIHKGEVAAGPTGLMHGAPEGRRQSSPAESGDCEERKKQ